VRTLGLVAAALGLLAVLLAGAAATTPDRPGGTAGLSPTTRIPAELVPVIEAAASGYCDLPPALLATVLKIESDFDPAAVNRNDPSDPADDAQGMGQILPGTWAAYGIDANGDGAADPFEAADAIHGAARYLCAVGADNPDTQRLAVAAYNAGPQAVRRAGSIPNQAQCPPSHPASLDRRCETADYVRKVFTQAAAYAAATTHELPAGDLLARVIGFAYAKVGTPYRWGGDGTNGYYDCSGFTMRAYAQAGVRLPRTARQQYQASPKVALGDRQAGDLLFWAYDTSDPGSIHHVAIYLGRDADGVDWMIDAPHTGATIQVRRVYWTGYLGATRPLDSP
jgi:cell wall-associated NlpC family hydrolase